MSYAFSFSADVGSLSPPPSPPPVTARLPLALQLRILRLSVPPSGPADWSERSDTLLSFSLVNRAWCAVARKSLVRAPVLRSYRSAELFASFTSVKANIRFAKKVKRLWLGSFDDGLQIGYANVHLTYIIWGCPHLEQLSLFNVAHVNLSLVAALPKLIRLELLYCSLDRPNNPNARLEKLRHLSVFGHQYLQLPSTSGLWDGRVVDRLLAMSPSLQSLATDEPTYSIRSGPSTLMGRFLSFHNSEGETLVCNVEGADVASMVLRLRMPPSVAALMRNPSKQWDPSTLCLPSAEVVLDLMAFVDGLVAVTAQEVRQVAQREESARLNVDATILYRAHQKAVAHWILADHSLPPLPPLPPRAPKRTLEPLGPVTPNARKRVCFGIDKGEVLPPSPVTPPKWQPTAAWGKENIRL